MVNYLNAVGIACARRGGAISRAPISGKISASTVDIAEAYDVGRKAVRVAAEEGSGYMSTILREPGGSIAYATTRCRWNLVANSERAFPKAWMAPSRTDVTDDYVAYANR